MKEAFDRRDGALVEVRENLDIIYLHLQICSKIRRAK